MGAGLSAWAGAWASGTPSGQPRHGFPLLCSALHLDGRPSAQQWQEEELPWGCEACSKALAPTSGSVCAIIVPHKNTSPQRV